MLCHCTYSQQVYMTWGRQDCDQSGISRPQDTLEVAVEAELEATDEGLHADSLGTVAVSGGRCQLQCVMARCMGSSWWDGTAAHTL